MWKKISIYTTIEGLDIVLGRLDALGITQAEIDEGIEAIDSYLHDAAEFWDYADPEEINGDKTPCVAAYIADLPENKSLIDSIFPAIEELKGMDIGIDMGSLEIKVHNLKEEDWANNWKAYYKPLCIGEKLLVCPSWENAGDTDRKVLKLDPGMAFGTGTHNTTRLCLEMVEKYVCDDMSILDLGCGSGILSIAAVLLGSSHALAVDIDPIVDSIARDNADMNGLGDEYKILVANILEDTNLQESIRQTHYDMVTANIVASVIIPLTPLVRDFLTPDGIYIASGIILDRLEEVKQAFEASGFEIIDERISGEWVALSAKAI